MIFTQAKSKGFGYYIYNCSGSLEGHQFLEDECTSLWDADHNLACLDLTVTCEVVAEDKKLTLPIQTAYKSFTNRIRQSDKLKINLVFQAIYNYLSLYDTNTLAAGSEQNY